jgi:GH25 family lysozyme M1 (1,4-beta-N-acetylmuramidase)
MTQPVTSYYRPDDPVGKAAAEASLGAYIAAGWTAVDAPVTETWVRLTVRKPIPALPGPLGPSETGLDISHWNNNDTALTRAQFALIRAAGHRFVWIKRTQGTTFVDKHGVANFDAAFGTIDWIGGYHFFEWDQNGAEQADHFSRTMGEALGNFPELIDVELESGVVVTDKLLAEANLRACLARCEERFLRKPVIYTNRNYWEAMFVPARVADLLTKYRFLIADWDGPLDQQPAGLPWVHFRQKSKAYQIPGIAGTFDLDEYRGDPPPTPPTVKHTFDGMSNQQVINVFQRAHNSLDPLNRTGLLGVMVGPGGVNRNLRYAGPALEDMRSLTAAEIAAVVNALT